MVHINYRDKLYTASYLAGAFGLKSAMELNKILEKLGVQRKEKYSNTWKFTKEYQGKKYDAFEVNPVGKTKEVLTRKFTWSGFLAMKKILQEKGYYKGF